MIRIVIAEDEPEEAVALKRNLDGRSDIVVVAMASDGQEAIDCCRKYHPDLVLMDIRMPVINGIDASKIIIREIPGIKILILTLFVEQEYIQEAIHLNTNGYILKGRPSEDIINCMKQAMSGMYVSDQIIMKTLNRTITASKPDEEDIRKENLLTETERKVVHLIILGKTNTEIASELNFTEGYIRNIITRILYKTQLRNSKALASWGFRMSI